MQIRVILQQQCFLLGGTSGPKTLMPGLVTPRICQRLHVLNIFFFVNLKV